MQTSFHLEKEVGEELGRGEVLQRAVQKIKELIQRFELLCMLLYLLLIEVFPTRSFVYFFN